jgi:hypothetical protein
MYYPYNQKSQPSIQSLWQDFRTRAMSKSAFEVDDHVNPEMMVARASPAEASGAQSRALQLVLAGLLGGAALGGTVTGLSGLHKMMKRPEPPTIPQELEMEMPVPEKRAEATQSPSVGVGTGDWWHGEHGKSPADLWWTIPATVGAATVGTLGMSGLVEHLLKKKRKDQMNQELQDASQQFQSSMLGQYKKSSADPLDRLFDKIEKRSALSFEGDQHGNIPAANAAEWAPLGVGAGITAAGLIAALAARGAYRASEGGTQEDLLNKAVKQRAYLQSLRSPEPVVFTPKRVATEQADDSQ